MIEKITDAIVLKAKDFKDNDKIVYLFSPSEGKISGVLKGVKKASAKLKFAGEPFCFAEFTYVRRGEMATITNCFEKESFFELRRDVERFYCGCAVLEIASAFIAENQPNPQLFVKTIKTLQLLTDASVPPKSALIKFILAVFENFGQKLSFGRCAECGVRIDGGALFDFSAGGTLCTSCGGAFAMPVDESVRKVIDTIDSCDEQRLCTYKCGDILLKRALDFFADVFCRNFKKINSLKQLAEM